MAGNKKLRASIEAADDEWRVQDDLRTLCQAEEIQKDPKRMAKVAALAKKKMVEMASIASEAAEDD